ncbi:MAG: ATP-binding protein [Cyclobacteriaceae bacterium]
MKKKPIKGKAVKKSSLKRKAMPEISEITQLKRQLKIEAALDRVRSIAMAMRRPEDLLKICKSLYRELKRLGISELRNAMINVYDDANGSFLNYDSSGEGGLSVTQFKNDSHPVIKNFLKQVRRTRDAFAPFSLQAKALQDFIRFRAINGEKTDVKLRKAKALHYYFYSVGNGSMGISTLEAIDPDHIKILKRFRNVFDLAYKRYTDIAIAKAQAHEVKIELALEKVRARTMAMKKSEELAEIVSVLFKQLLGLGLTLDQLRTCGIATFHPSEPQGEIWITDIKGEKISNSFSAPFNEAPAYKTIYKNWKKGEDFLELNLRGKDFLEHLKFVQKYSSVPDINLKEIKKKYKEIFFHVLYFSQGYLFIIAYEELIEHHELFKRFGAIFEQTYTRFLDLQKSEAQAREAQIELALERVRARTMAMQKSEELKEVIQLVYDQFVQLDIHIEHTGFILDYKTRDNMHIWLADKNEVPAEITIPYFDSPHWNSFIQARRKGTDFFANHLSFKEKNKFYRSLFKLIPNVAKKTREYYLGCPGLAISTVLLDNVGLCIENFSGIPYTSEENGTLMRFGKVFQQTYTRFLDLQKAEAQARDAQIEAALERVRSRSLAMHHSYEIKEVVLMVMEKMNELEIEMDGGVSLATFRDGSRDLTHWYVNPEHVDGAIEMHLPYFKNKLFTDFEKARKQGMELLPVVYSFEDKNEYFNYAFKHSEFKIIPKALKQWILEQPCFGYSVAIQKHSAIFFNDYSGKFFSEQENQVLIRFAKVFDQAYIRFLDLQKAEAQAREAEIQLALERVRARTMAMQNSSELAEVSYLLNKQVVELGIPTRGCAFNIYNEHDSTEWFSNLEGTLPTYKTPRENVFLKYYEAGQRGETLFIEEYSGRNIIEHYKYLFKAGIFGKDIKEKAIKAITPEVQIDHVAYFKYGYLLFITLTPAPEAHDTFKRFAKEFQQTYTRFLDLQKSEAQAREAQIELALERVRARTMAMQQSAELRDAGNMVFQQMKELGIEAETSWLWFIDPKKDSLEIWTTHENKLADPVKVRASDLWTFKKEIDGWKKGKPSLELSIPKKEAIQSIKKVFGVKIHNNKLATHFHLLQTRHQFGFLGLGTWHEATKEERQICSRFSKVFEQTYRRFLDLQKAEAQAREAQIEAALERVRAKTMAMHSSDDVNKAVVTFFGEIKKLGIEQMSCGLNILHKSGDMETWTAKGVGKDTVATSGKLDMLVHPSVKKLFKDWKAKKTSSIYELKGKEVKDFFKIVYAQRDYSTPKVKLPDRLFLNNFLIPEGSLWAFTHDELEAAHADVLKRFAHVFSLTYGRYKDLQKAEAQAREAKIETALERVRSRTMGMQKSEELGEVITLVFQQFIELGIRLHNANFAVGNVKDWQKKNRTFWVANLGAPHPIKVLIPYVDHRMFNRVIQEAKKGSDFLEDTFGFEEKNSYFRHWFDKGIRENRNLAVEKKVFKSPGYARSVALCNDIELAIGKFEPVPFSSEENVILRRFAKVFEQTYTRFLDLQKAEAQAREAQIEAALERVRSRSLAMHKSDDLLEVINTVSEQLQQLGIKFHNTSFGINSEGKDYSFWMASPHQPHPYRLDLPYMANPMPDRVIEAKKNNIDFFADILSKKDNLSWHKHVLKNAGDNVFPEEVKSFILSRDGYARSTVFMKNIFLTVGNYVPKAYAESENEIFRRFAKVFDQSYTRFLDLQKAETQTREAQIEAALERVRARSMAMHKSDELLDVITVVSEQLTNLDFKFHHVSFANNDLDQDYKFWVSARGLPNPMRFNVPYLDISIMKQLREAQHNGDNFYTDILSKEENRRWHKHLLNHGGDKVFPEDVNEFAMSRGMARSIAINPNIMLILANYASVPYTEDENKIIARFGQVFEQSYTRFLDLQKAEASARDAKRQASLDRVRGEIASMRSTKDLQRITPLVWKELASMEIPFTRCGVFIMDEVEKLIHAYLSASGGQSLGVLHLSFDSTAFTSGAIDHWQQQKNYITHWDQSQFVQNMKAMIEQGQIKEPTGYQGGEKPPESLHLHFIHFKQGMLYVGNDASLNKEAIDSVKTLADSFSVAYARYEDFKKLEEAKAQVENTLTDLKAAQSQLIQSEKMASLGELTAGIAHEIQNPLNFVNNFSEVSTELVDEMKSEIDAGNNEEAKEIAADLKENLQKINHHGKRAGDIVKGMLQHSRSSSGQKELTDINTLADEYLRLAYHGLRAKDKSFNASMKTDFDNSLEKVNVIPQDIGRVILNLITNAFYVVNEKKKQNTEGYDPIVIVSTKKVGGCIEVGVKDNGNGISDSIKEKIFQPFFTTKPTGQGTGLGLSLSYDIVKAHGGELKVESKEGEGSEFVIELPIV